MSGVSRLDIRLGIRLNIRLNIRLSPLAKHQAGSFGSLRQAGITSEVTNCTILVGRGHQLLHRVVTILCMFSLYFIEVPVGYLQ